MKKYKTQRKHAPWPISILGIAGVLVFTENGELGELFERLSQWEGMEGRWRMVIGRAEEDGGRQQSNVYSYTSRVCENIFLRRSRDPTSPYFQGIRDVRIYFRVSRGATSVAL